MSNGLEAKDDQNTSMGAGEAGAEKGIDIDPGANGHESE